MSKKVLRPHVFDLAAELFEHLVDRHGADRHGRGGDDRFADRVDALAGREVHHRVGAEVDGRVQLLELAFEAAGDGRVADVGVHLAPGGDADAHRLEPAGEVDRVGRNDHPAGGDFVADERRLELLALGDEFHLRRDLAGTGAFELRNRLRHQVSSASMISAPEKSRGGPTRRPRVVVKAIAPIAAKSPIYSAVYPIAMAPVVNEQHAARVKHHCFVGRVRRQFMF